MLLHAVIGDVDVCEPVAVVIGECHSRAMPLLFGNIVTICHVNSPRGGTINQQKASVFRIHAVRQEASLAAQEGWCGLPHVITGCFRG